MPISFSSVWPSKRPALGAFSMIERGGVQVFEEFVYLPDAEVGNRVEVVRAVAPFGEVADVGLARVAGAGDEAVLGVGDGVERRHAQARRYVGDGHVRELRHALEGGELGLAHGREVDDARLYIELLRDLHAVVAVEAVVATTRAGHDEAERVFAGGLAEYAHEGRVLAAEFPNTIPAQCEAASCVRINSTRRSIQARNPS